MRMRTAQIKTLEKIKMMKIEFPRMTAGITPDNIPKTELITIT